MYDRKVLLVTLGHYHVGKTSISKRWFHGEFSEEQFSTVGGLHFEKIIELDGLRVLVEMWDTAGQERFEALAKQYWERAEASLIVYDIRNRASFERVKYWGDVLVRESKGKAVVAVVANMIDLEDSRRVARREGEEYAEKHGFLFYETSARSGQGVDEAFLGLIKAVPLTDELRATLSISAYDKDTKSGCC